MQDNRKKETKVDNPTQPNIPPQTPQSGAPVQQQQKTPVPPQTQPQQPPVQQQQPQAPPQQPPAQQQPLPQTQPQQPPVQQQSPQTQQPLPPQQNIQPQAPPKPNQPPIGPPPVTSGTQQQTPVQYPPPPPGPVPPNLPPQMRPPQGMPPPMQLPSQQAPPGQLTPQPQNKPFVPMPNQDPYCFPGKAPVYEEPKETTTEHTVTSETEKVVEFKNETEPFLMKDEVVEHDVIIETVEDAPNMETTTVDLQSASVVEVEKERVIEFSDDVAFKVEEESETVVESKKKESVWKPPDAEE